MSGLASSTSTPMRAITSTLSLRSAPSIPPSTLIYEPLVKSVLRHRLLFNIFPFSALFTWALVGFSSLWIRGGVARLGLVGTLVNPILPTTLMVSIFAWVFCVLPILVLRKVLFTASPTIATSPSEVFYKALGKSSTVRSLLSYSLSAVLFIAIHIFMVYIYSSPSDSDSRFTFFVKSKKHPYYLNGRTLYLFSSQITLASLYLLRNVMLDRFTVRWSSSLGVSNKNELQAFRLARIITGSLTVIVLSMIAIISHTVLFGLSRSLVLPVLFKIPVVSKLLRPFAAHFLRGPLSFVLLMRNWSLVCRAFMVGLMTIASWEFAESIFDSSVAEPIIVAYTTADPALTLISGISSSDIYFKHFAYSELRQLASEESSAASTRRSALFSDQKYNPNMWSTLAREALLTLGKDYQHFLRRGKPAPVAPPPTAPPIPAPPVSIPSTPLIRTPITKPDRRSPLRSALDTLASDGAITTAVASTSKAGTSQIPELFRSVISEHPSVKVAAETAAEKVKKGEENVQKVVASASKGKWKEHLYGEFTRRAPKWVLDIEERLWIWWSRERLSKVAEGSLPNRKMDALAIEVVCSLICASLTEDRYGVVQRDIPRILEALLSFLTAIEEYQKELSTQYTPISPEEMHKLSPKELAEKEKTAIEASKAGDILSEVGDALKEGVVRIVRTFGDRLTAFRFPPRIARKLQGFVDYN